MPRGTGFRGLGLGLGLGLFCRPFLPLVIHLENLASSHRMAPGTARASASSSSSSRAAAALDASLGLGVRRSESFATFNNYSAQPPASTTRHSSLVVQGSFEPWRRHFARSYILAPVLLLLASTFLTATVTKRDIRYAVGPVVAVFFSTPWLLRGNTGRKFLWWMMERKPWRRFFFRMIWRPHISAVAYLTAPLLAAKLATRPCMHVCLEKRIGVCKAKTPARLARAIRFVAISDTHTRHRFLQLPHGADVLVHCGDFTMPEVYPAAHHEALRQLCDFFAHAARTCGFRCCIFVPGNHDKFVLGLGPRVVQEHLDKHVPCEARLLVDAGIWLRARGSECGGVALWGSPMSRANSKSSPNDAFQTSYEKEHEVPQGVLDIPREGKLDILVTHGPPASSDARGCKSLDAVLDNHEIPQPRIHVFGHTHEGAGEVKARSSGRCIAVNATSIDLSFCASQPPILFDVPFGERDEAPHQLEVVSF